MASSPQGAEGEAQVTAIPPPADLSLLLPSVQPVMRRVLQDLRARGFQPIPRGTTRTAAQAAANLQNRRGILDSMHRYRIAVDWVCGEHGWSCAEHHCGFFQAVGQVAESLGLTWGGRWRKVDLPHTQAIAVRDQTRFRRLTTDDARDAFVRTRLIP